MQQGADIGRTSASEGGSSNVAAAVGLAKASSTPVFCSASTLNSPSGSPSLSAMLLPSGSVSCNQHKQLSQAAGRHSSH